MTGLRIAAIGECMIELAASARRRPQDDPWHLGFAGDSANTATYLARLLAGTHAGVAYVTAIGDDPFSEAMIEGWQGEGIDTSHVQRIGGCLPGLYAIRTDDRGERQFFYWRQQAAARRMLDDETAFADALAQADYAYLSGITLAILPPPMRQRLIGLLAHRRDSLKIVFDPNFRPRLWADRQEAQAAFGAMAGIASIMLPTFDDEAELFGDATPEETIARLTRAGVAEMVVKCGGEPCHVRADGEAYQVTLTSIDRPLDTTGAGDSFNAGYLAARLIGNRADDAAAFAHALAACVVMHRGAIIPPEATPKLTLAP